MDESIKPAVPTLGPAGRRALSPFDAPRLKIERAKKHRDEFMDAIRAYMAGDPIRLIVEELKKFPGMHCWVVRFVEPMPTEMSAIIGDVIHNLRTALDLTAADLVKLHGKSVKGVYFPFCAKESDLDEMIRSRKFDRAGPAAVALLKALKPYKGGNPELRAIHDLDILDKHQALLPMASAALTPSMNISFFGNAPIDLPEIRPKIDYDGQPIWIMPPVSNLPLGTKLDVYVGIIFGDEAKDYQGWDIIDALTHFIDITEGVVESFASLPRP